MVQRDEIDLILTDLSFSVRRQEVVDHLFPLFDYLHSFVYWRPSSKIGWLRYLRAFHPHFWAALATSLALTAGVLWWAWGRRDSEDMALHEAVSYVISCTVCRHGLQKKNLMTKMTTKSCKYSLIRELDQAVATGARPTSLRILLLTVLGTFIVMKTQGVMLERISLGALIIALGMLVDNAIVVVEGILVSFLAVTVYDFPYNDLSDLTRSDLELSVPVGTFVEEVMTSSTSEMPFGDFYNTKLKEGKIR